MRGDELICQHSGVDHVLCTGNSVRCLACLYKQNGSVCLAPNCTPGLAPCLACRKCWIHIYWMNKCSEPFATSGIPPNVFCGVQIVVFWKRWGWEGTNVLIGYQGLLVVDITRVFDMPRYTVNLLGGSKSFLKFILLETCSLDFS